MLFFTDISSLDEDACEEEPPKRDNAGGRRDLLVDSLFGLEAILTPSLTEP
jgi:hypothetical protein